MWKRWFSSLNFTCNNITLLTVFAQFLLNLMRLMYLSYRFKSLTYCGVWLFNNCWKVYFSTLGTLLRWYQQVSSFYECLCVCVARYYLRNTHPHDTHITFGELPTMSPGTASKHVKNKEILLTQGRNTWQEINKRYGSVKYRKRKFDGPAKSLICARGRMYFWTNFIMVAALYPLPTFNTDTAAR